MSLLKPILRRLFGVSQVSGRRSRQQGYIVISLALVGLVTGTIVAVPSLQRAIGALRSTEITSSVSQNNIRDAAEHALWRLEHDPTVYDEMTGDPPTITYVLNFPSGPASITIEASSQPPDDSGLTTAISAFPSILQPDTPTMVSFTIDVENNDVQSHDIVRLEADPQVFNPAYVLGSTTGITNADPVYTAGRWRWDLASPVSISPFGGSASMSFLMLVNEGEGDYRTGAAAQIDGFGSVTAPHAGIRVLSAGDLQIWTEATPIEVRAGSLETIDFTVTVLNNGASDLTFEWVKHWTSRDFDHIPGSTTGITTTDPSRNHDVINNRWEWTWDVDGIPIPVGVPIELHFQMTADLLPGTYTSESDVRTEEDTEANGQEATAGSGPNAPITAVRWVTVGVVQSGKTVDIGATVDANGVTVAYWDES